MAYYPPSWVEFHHKVGDEKELKYEGHRVTPICSDRFQEISAANIEMITKDEREPLAKDAICSAFHCPLAVIAEFDNWEESGWMLMVQLQGTGQQTTLFVHLYQTIRNW